MKHKPIYYLRLTLFFLILYLFIGYLLPDYQASPNNYYTDPIDRAALEITRELQKDSPSKKEISKILEKYEIDVR